MRRGEKARIWAGPKYGYGEKGSFSFPTVPPNADLV
jgi:FKBP-type peptidyl-prolyl cis-trans isomerase